MSASAAARIPEELFPYIIQYLPVPIDDYYLPRDRIRDSGVVVGSLVCMDWAKRCREMLFRERTVRIGSMESAVRFRNLVMGAGCERLTAIVGMIAEVDVEHDLDKDGRSWYHILGALMPRLPRSKFRMFYIKGPRSKLAAGLRFRTPYWGVAKPLPQFVTQYRRLYLRELHFASIGDLVCFADHFPHLEELQLLLLTWDETGVRAPAVTEEIPRPDPCHRSLRSIWVQGCTPVKSASTHINLYQPWSGGLISVDVGRPTCSYETSFRTLDSRSLLTSTQVDSSGSRCTLLASSISGISP